MEEYTFLRICPFIHISFVIVPYEPLYISGVRYNFSFFIFYRFGSFLFFFLTNRGKVLSILFMFSNNYLLVPLICLPLFFFFTISFMSALIFMIYCLPLTLGFVYFFFSSSLQCKFRLFICDFPCFITMLL